MVRRPDLASHWRGGAAALLTAALAIAAHALAAAAWCGGLAALLVTVRHRGGWALPRFSRLSLIRSVLEVAVMIVALTMAATLS